MILQKFPPQFFWNIETLWEKYFENKSSKTDFSGLEEVYRKFQGKNLAGLEDLPDLGGKNTRNFTLTKKPNFTLSENSVFEDENFQKFLGLQEYSVCFQENKKPVYVFDNHHQALFPFWEISQEQKKQLTIVHIDAHRDDAVFNGDTKNLAGLQDLPGLELIISKCRVSDYLDAGKKIGLISEIISITQESEFQKFLDSGLEKLLSEKTPYILNLDIDIYGPEGTAVSSALKTEVIAKAWSHAEAVCFATSPGFIDSDVAKKLGKIMI